MQKQDKDQIDFTLAQAPFNATLPITKLLHFIREEKSFFVEKIVPSDLQRIVCVRGKMTNNRIVSQSGAFLIFGLGAKLAADHPSIFTERVSINKNDKKKTLDELDALNINESTVLSVHRELSEIHFQKVRCITWRSTSLSSVTGLGQAALARAD